MKNLFIVAIGAVFGATSRYLLLNNHYVVLGQHQHLKVFALNILGSSLFGLIIAFLPNSLNTSVINLLLFSGFLGSFTTFSAFAFDMHTLLVQGRFISAAINASGQVFFSVMFLSLSFKFGQWLMDKM